MLVLILPDVHLKPWMFDRAEKILESGQAERAVSLGDLLDDWEQENNLGLYRETLERAIAFRERFPNTLWTTGNHDFAYRHPEQGRNETGHSYMAELEVAPLIEKLPQKVMHVVDDVIFTHAGLTTSWVNRQRQLVEAPEFLSPEQLSTLVNFAAPNELWQENSPIWVRLQQRYQEKKSKLDRDYPYKPEKYFQMVGHTPMETPTQEGSILSTDVFSTYSGGAPIGNQKFVVVDTKTKEWKEAEEPWLTQD